MPFRALLCWFALVSCGETDKKGGQSGDEGGNRTHEISRSGGDTPVPNCRRLESDGPDGPRRDFVCRHDQPDVSWNPNKPTPAGTYRCECDGTSIDVLDATGCDNALAEGCQLDLKAPLPCTAREVDARCWPAPGQPDQWNCQCGASVELLAATGSVCQEVAFLACATGCNDILGQAQQLGQCAVKSDAIGYDCTCKDGLSASWAEIADCRRALTLSCLPACETSRGQCAQRSNGFDCICETESAGASLTATEPVYASNDKAYGNCPLALEIACGFPVAGEACEEIEDYGVRLSCEADGNGDWNCQCPVPEGCSDNARYASGELPGAGIPLPARMPFDAPPAGLLEQPRTCRAAIGAYCGCP